MINKKIMLFGHRGIPALSTENSLDSFQKILDNKIPGVEFDVHLTADGELVVKHDFNTLKMTGVNHEVAETDYSLLKTLPIGDEEYIPLLSQVFDILKDKVYYDIEIKSNGKNRKQLVQNVSDMIFKYNLQNDCFVSSFDPYLIKEFNKLKTGIKVGLIYSDVKELPFIARHGLGAFITSIQIIKPDHKQLKGFIHFILTKVLKKTCYTWTVNSQEDYDYAVKKGCVGVCSDNAHLLTR